MSGVDEFIPPDALAEFVQEQRKAKRGEGNGRDGGAGEEGNPLDGLAEKSAADPGAPFIPEALKRLATLKKDNRATFEALRSKLKKAGCRVTALDEAIAEENGDAGGRGPTQADILIELAQSAELFHAPDRTGFADLEINDHRETWPIRTKGFRRWLARRFSRIRAARRVRRRCNRRST